LYIGVTNSLERRASEHSLGFGSAFARQYNAHKLIYFETCSDPRTAIAREKQLKRWSRAKKEALIARRNPEWRDLFEQMYALQPCNDSR
jgi:predicted GIY-YIG superfamily endonuclease